MDEKLPLLISIPHGGDAIPDEIKGRTSLTARDIFEDGDPLTREIYDFKGKVAACVQADVGRAFVDLNRKASDLPPENPDGVLKLHTLTGKSVYNDGEFPDEALRRRLLDRYYHPYYQEIEGFLGEKKIRLALDCHAMLASPPFFSPTPHEKRPMICLSNGGDSRGERGRDRRLTCPPPWIRNLSDCLSRTFDRERGAVRINDPFKGGHLSMFLSRGRVPWIQVEINRDLYLSPPWYDEARLSVSPERITHINAILLEAITSWVRFVF